MSANIHHQEEDEATGLILKIVHDSDPLNPRVDYDEASVMVCDHGCYALGDKDGHEKACEAIRACAAYQESWEDEESDDYLDFSHGPDLYQGMIRCQDEIVFRCLFLYDHSGITMSTSPFSCRWDSGQVGFAFMDEARMKATYMVDEVTHEIRERARSLIDSEVKVYDDYLTGNCWGFIIEDQDGDVLDSCWGFLGDSKYCEEEAQGIYKAYIADKVKDDAFMDKLGIPAIPA